MGKAARHADGDAANPMIVWESAVSAGTAG
jgi:hypothetical protein